MSTTSRARSWRSRRATSPGREHRLWARRDACASIVETIGRLTDRADLLELGALPYAHGDPMVVAADVAKLATTGFTPRWTLEDGLADAVRWWSGRLESR